MMSFIPPKVPLKVIVSIKVNNTALLSNVCTVFTESEQAAPEIEYQCQKHKSKILLCGGPQQTKECVGNPGQLCVQVGSVFVFCVQIFMITFK